MATNLFTFVELFSRVLDTAAHILAKGAEHARAQGIAESDFLNWRLIDDMRPLSFQLSVVCDFARQWPARAAGLPVPADIDVPSDVATFQRTLAEAKAYVAQLTSEQFEGRDEVPVTYAIATGGLTPTLPAARWITVFATTNLYFHLSTAYAILRSHGVPIGKVDLFPTGL